jgi:CO/xanthine dehydrogenase FAD-binding subunit
VKPAAFEYAAPRDLDGALALLGEDARPLAGGQSLVPMMNFRIAQPSALVDLNGVEGLSGLRVDEAGALRIGALTRHAELERSTLVAEGWPLLRQAVRHVGHPPVRTRGTAGGSCAHGDPTAELPAALRALDARLHVRSRAGARVIDVADFFLMYLTTALRPDELLVEIEVPPLPDGAGTGFAEHARTHGDWADAGAAVVVAPGHAAIALLGAAPTPVRATEAEAALAGGAARAEAAALAGALVADAWKRAMTTALVGRALAEAGA